MPKFRFTGDSARVFPDAGWHVTRATDDDAGTPRGHVEPGDVVEADENPDTRFFEEVATGKRSAASVPAATSEED